MCDTCVKGINLWTPERIRKHLREGKLLPHNWRVILETAGSTPPPEQTTLV